MEPTASADLDPDERAAVRAFLQRCEVRLSTLHRTAVALLSGAGLLVVLPVVARDAVSGVLRSLLAPGARLDTILLVAAMVAVVAVPVVALWYLFGDLTRFFFHAHHLSDGADARFTPRFTLTSLRVPADELGPVAAGRLDEIRHSDRLVELLVPPNPVARDSIDHQLAIYGDPGDASLHGDARRAAGLSELAAARSRALLEEAAKVELGMARHVLKLRVLVLRYVKALLAVLTSAAAVYAADAVTADLVAHPSPAAAAGVAAIGLLWAPAVVVSVTAPVRWVEGLMRAEGATTTAVREDPELTYVERVSLRIATAGWIAAAAAMVVTLADADAGTTTRAWGVVAVAASLSMIAVSARVGRLRSLVSLRPGRR
jgi:hypothetical protein